MQEQPQKYLLGGIRCVLLIVQQAEANPPNAGPEPFHQRNERGTVGTLPSGLRSKLLVATS